jgi:hypothetical protein
MDDSSINELTKCIINKLVVSVPRAVKCEVKDCLEQIDTTRDIANNTICSKCRIKSLLFHKR